VRYGGATKPASKSFMPMPPSEKKTSLIRELRPSLLDDLHKVSGGRVG